MQGIYKIDDDQLWCLIVGAYFVFEFMIVIDVVSYDTMMKAFENESIFFTK